MSSLNLQPKLYCKISDTDAFYFVQLDGDGGGAVMFKLLYVVSIRPYSKSMDRKWWLQSDSVEGHTGTVVRF